MSNLWRGKNYKKENKMRDISGTRHKSKKKANRMSKILIRLGF